MLDYHWCIGICVLVLVLGILLSVLPSVLLTISIATKRLIIVQYFSPSSLWCTGISICCVVLSIATKVWSISHHPPSGALVARPTRCRPCAVHAFSTPGAKSSIYNIPPPNPNTFCIFQFSNAKLATPGI